MWRSRLRAQHGFALPSAMLVSTLVSGVVIVLFAGSLAEMKGTKFHQDFENAIHAAEAGAYRLIAVINEVGDFDSGVLHPPPAGVSEHDWALSVADAAPAHELVQAANGWAYSFRPRDALTSKPTPFIYAVGTVGVSGSAMGVQRRVVKIEFDNAYYRPAHALLANGQLEIDKANVSGAAGRAHGNGAVTLKGPPVVNEGVTHATTASGTYRTTPTSTAVPSTKTDEPVHVPEVSALGFYEVRFHDNPRTDEPYAGTWFATSDTPTAGGKDPLTYDGDWFDMCIQTGMPHASVRVPADKDKPPCSGGEYRLLNRTSCGSAAELDPSDPQYLTKNSLFRGWHAHSDFWHICHAFPEEAGIFFLDGAANKATKVDAKATTPSRITIISNHGLEIGNNMVLDAFLPGYLLQAEGALDISGSHTLNGAIASREEITLTGSNTVVNGPVISNNKSGRKTVVKDVTINYAGGMALPLPGLVRIISWNELTPAP
jgi:hypothetical protein